MLFLFMGCVEYYPAVRMQSGILLPQCSARQQSAYAEGLSQNDKITFGYARCEHSADAGFVADHNSAVPAELRDLPIPFGKSLDVVPLNAVLAASARSTWTYIQENFAVEVYRMPPVNPQGCLLFQELDVAPSNVRCVFDNHASSVGGAHGEDEVFGPRGILQGLYWAAGYINTSTQTYSSARAIIYVRTDASRWTLVHEFVHHLFREQRIREGVPVYNLDLATNARSQLLSELEQMQTAVQVSSSDLQRLISLAEQLTRVGTGYLLQNDLEEATIEYILYNLYKTRLLSYTQSNAPSSIDYIYVSVRRARQYGEMVLELLEQTEDVLQTNRATLDQLSQIDALKFQVRDLLHQADNVATSVY